MHTIIAEDKELIDFLFSDKDRKEIVRNGKSINLVVNVHTCGYFFCNECKKKLNDFAGNKISKYENKLVEEFVNDGRRKDNV